MDADNAEDDADADANNADADADAGLRESGGCL